MKELRYIDATQLGCGAVFCKDYDLIYAGTTIASMPESADDDTYMLLADKYDIRFIFDSNVTTVNFYALPRVDIFATDSNNGYWGTIGDATDIENMSAQICYVNNHNEIFIVADNLKNFIFPIDSINERRTKTMNKTDDVVLYSSKKDAEKAVKFIEIPKLE
ncbi:MAG TPA: hypothetical protein VN258_02175 [Mobilitalea sp.]|nr:hypothetical protein [Mobilitalea sp.]